MSEAYRKNRGKKSDHTRLERESYGLTLAELGRFLHLPFFSYNRHV